MSSPRSSPSPAPPAPTSIADALLADILNDPADDTPRLVYADWLEERNGEGDVARAKLIRVQVALAQWKGADEQHCPECGLHWKWRVGAGYGEWSDCVNDHRWTSQTHRDLRRRERELLEPHWSKWARPIPATYLLNAHPDAQGAVGVEYRRGFLYRVRCRLADWLGGVCGLCNDGWVWEDYWGYWGGAGSKEDRQWEAECSTCHGTGRTPGHGAAIMRRQPVEWVEVADRRPFEWVTGRWWWLNEHRNDTDHQLSRLPYPLWKSLNPSNDENKPAEWPTEATARTALSAALIRLAKEQS